MGDSKVAPASPTPAGSAPSAPAAAQTTPMMRQYQRMKARAGDALLLFRLGDFYELFNDDAVTASKTLGLMLTRKSVGGGRFVPLAGIPHHSSENYIARLIRAGYKVAICEQMEDPAKAKGLVDRAIIRIVTPGTLVEENLLVERCPNRLGALARSGGRTALALADVSTGEFLYRVWEDGAAGLADAVDNFEPKEILVSEGESAPFNGPVTPRPAADVPAARDRVTSRFGAAGLAEAALEPPALHAIAMLIDYLAETAGQNFYLRAPRRISDDRAMELDAATVRNLDLVSSGRVSVFDAPSAGSADATLLGVVDRSRTAAGGRRMRAWILRPLIYSEDIIHRAGRVQALVEHPRLLDDLRAQFGHVADIERIFSRLRRDVTARVADLVHLRATLNAAPAIIEIVRRISEFDADAARLPDTAPLAALLNRTLADEPSAQLGDGDVIRAGVDSELDDLRLMVKNQRLFLLKLQDQERKRTGVQSLKVSYNRVFGYYIEISRVKAQHIPDTYIRKQTLANAERFITPELKEFEDKLLTATDRISKIERALFDRLLCDALVHAPAALELAAFLADLDALCGLADLARREGWVRPQISADDILDIRDGRHPVVERFCPDGFVPNHSQMDSARRLAIVTGPNMAGKSTFIRQTAVLVLLAQVGSFVPAASMRWKPVDRILTRIGAADDLARGRSTFMVEMSETAAILREATRDSLIILDELGRGTSTYDGLSIAWSIVEHIAGRIGARTLFATHYHELTRLAGDSGIHTLAVRVKEWEGKVVFLRKVMPGVADRSFGIAVAELAGIPPEVLRRAEEILAELESGRLRAPAVEPAEPALFPEPSPLALHEQRVIEKLRAADPNRTTPLEALSLLERLRKEIMDA